MTLVPRGLVLCLGPDHADLQAQAVQALRAGNRVLAVAPGAPQALVDLVEGEFPLIAVDGVVMAEALSTLPVDAVAHAAPDPASRRALANRTGPILPLIDRLTDPAAYTLERAVCIDTHRRRGQRLVDGQGRLTRQGASTEARRYSSDAPLF